MSKKINAIRERPSFLKRLIEERFFFALLLGVIVTTILRRHLPVYSRDDFKIVYSLLVFLVIVKGLERHNFFAFLQTKIKSTKFLGVKLVAVCAVLSALVTNDVAVIFMVPFTLALPLKHKEYLVILEAIAANVSSSLSPFGNPQNMFIYYHYHVAFSEFVKAIYLFVLALMSLVFALSFFFVPSCQKFTEDKRPALAPAVLVYIVSFLIFVAAVLRFLPLAAGSVILALVFLFDRNIFKQIDYFLLLTFLAFFGFTDNLAYFLHFNLNSSFKVFTLGVLCSQIISNVPTALLLADFTTNWRSLLWGVSVGGVGVLHSSLATLIAFRFCQKKIKDVWLGAKFLLAGLLFLLAGFFAYLALFK